MNNEMLLCFLLAAMLENLSLSIVAILLQKYISGSDVPIAFIRGMINCE